MSALANPPVVSIMPSGKDRLIARGEIGDNGGLYEYRPYIMFRDALVGPKSKGVSGILYSLRSRHSRTLRVNPSVSGA